MFRRFVFSQSCSIWHLYLGNTVSSWDAGSLNHTVHVVTHQTQACDSFRILGNPAGWLVVLCCCVLSTFFSVYRICRFNQISVHLFYIVWLTCMKLYVTDLFDLFWGDLLDVNFFFFSPFTRTLCCQLTFLQQFTNKSKVACHIRIIFLLADFYIRSWRRWRWRYYSQQGWQTADCSCHTNAYFQGHLGICVAVYMASKTAVFVKGELRTFPGPSLSPIVAKS